MTLPAINTSDMRARADWLERWCDEKTVPAMLRAGADAIEKLRLLDARLRMRERLRTDANGLVPVRKEGE